MHFKAVLSRPIIKMEVYNERRLENTNIKWQNTFCLYTLALRIKSTEDQSTAKKGRLQPVLDSIKK